VTGSTADPARPLAPGDRVGFVGLGRMGLPMLSRLAAAGYQVVGHDTDATARDRTSRAVPAATVVDEAGAVADRTRAVILMLPSSAAVQSVLGEQLARRLTPGQLVVDMGSSEPPETVRHAAALCERGIGFVDAPVSGGVSGAETGRLTIMIGGSKVHLELVRPVLAVLGNRIVAVGSVGAGHAVKAINNLLSASHLLATSEAMVVAERFGLDIERVLDAINTSSGRSGSTEAKWPRFVLPQTYDSGFALQLMLKDMQIALSLARYVDSAAPLAEAAIRQWSAAAAALPASADHTEIARWVRERAEQG
jgi:3-hydroxyisobutyrate dehydrogenase